MPDVDLEVKLAVYRHFAGTARRPSAGEIGATLGLPGDEVLASFRRLVGKRVLVLDDDGASIRMAPPFSGIPTQHVAVVEGREHFANCAWDVFGIVAACGGRGTALSRCEQSREPLELEIGNDGPEASDWLFHSAVPAARWWDDIVFT